MRMRSFGEGYDPTPVDRFGVWLSARQIRRRVGSFAGKRVADIGAGYHAEFSRTLAATVASLLVFDISISPAVKALPNTRAIEGRLPDSLQTIADASLDVVICNSVLEHLWDPLQTVTEMHRIAAPGGLVLINVPNWMGKRFLELAAFRLGVSPPDEMEDHKTYFDPRDLWPLLVKAGFRPSQVRCFRHKFGLNTFAVCRR
jgi:2-polyprenyl-3-methyl-5-hydroxy-6-metoxy-1,4-benzoquinol methylase